MLHATVDQMDEARRRNITADYLASKPIAYKPELLPDRAALELKIDGIGLLDINGRLSSLEGVDFECALHLAHELAAIRQAFGTEMMLQGEFFEPGGFNATLASFRSGKSEAGAVVLWDAVPLKAWHGYEQSATLLERRTLLQAAFDAVNPGMVSLLSWTPVPDHSTQQISRDAFVRGALAKALETSFADGVVVKDVDAPYVRGPSPFTLKVKAGETIDVPVQSVRYRDGRVQSIVVTVDGKPAVVGSGISEALRDRPEEFRAGRLVEIRHVGKLESGALRGASFVRFRDDKERPTT